MNQRMQREIGAGVWARKMYGDEATLVCYLQKGDKFSFPKSDKIYTYSGRGWYKNEKGVSFRTGTLTACFKR